MTSFLYLFIESLLFCLRKITLVYAAKRALEILGQILEFRSSCDPFLGKPNLFIVLPTTNVTYVFAHISILLFYLHNSSASAEICSLFSSVIDDKILTCVSAYSKFLLFSSIARMTFPAIGAQLPFSINATVLFWKLCSVKC